MVLGLCLSVAVQAGQLRGAWAVTWCSLRSPCRHSNHDCLPFVSLLHAEMSKVRRMPALCTSSECRLSVPATAHESRAACTRRDHLPADQPREPDLMSEGTMVGRRLTCTLADVASHRACRTAQMCRVMTRNEQGERKLCEKPCTLLPWRWRLNSCHRTTVWSNVQGRICR